MKTKIVTFLYFGIEDFPFYGHRVQARWDRYKNSLVQLSEMGLPIICYCGNNIYPELKKYLELNNVNNVDLRIRELDDFRHSKSMINIKENHPEKFKFYLEVGWAKIALMEEEMEDDLDYLYWVDVGLSHIGLFPYRFNSNGDKSTGTSTNKYRYTYDGIFNDNTFKKINNWVGNKLINLTNTQFFHNASILNNVLEKEHKYKSLTVGGIIGGHVSKLPKLFKSFEDYSQVCLKKEYLLNHEAMMSTMAYDNPDDYKTFVFDTWYHDDTPDKHITKEFLSNKKSFYRFFEEI
jgi:hypothetical protein